MNNMQRISARIRHFYISYLYCLFGGNADLDLNIFNIPGSKLFATVISRPAGNELIHSVDVLC